ncbi:glycyl radical protein [Alkalibacter mobilis]|uniref:glycyl radical protein n=1 Tax=Alkalibacter mobilis TaxID=2787712 RepID=UPI00189CE7CE|nr:pyruvate formate lyase family protein [Alkalibacter mobilis]MBF7095616.1 hypothetical protein [Alkalibacter mobilis]
MFKFAPVSPRINTLMEKRLAANKGRTILDAERTQIYTEYYKVHESEPIMLKRAHCLYEWCSRKTILVEDEDIFVGQIGRTYRSLNSFVEWDATWLYEATHDDDTSFKKAWQGSDSFAYMSDSDREIFREASEYWLDKSLSARYVESIPPILQKFQGNGCSDFFARKPNLGGVPQGHYCPNFQKIISIGFGGIKKEIQNKMDDLQGKIYGKDAYKFLFYQSADIVCDAAILFSKRYAEECNKQAQNHTDPVRKAELKRMANSLNWIMENPARTAWEALQTVILYQIMLIADGQQHGLSQGRIDQYAGWFAEEELSAGTLTLEELQDYSDAFYLKLNDNLIQVRMSSNDMLSKMYSGKGYSYNSGGHHFTLGGVKKDGSDASNALTRCMLNTTGRMFLADPSVDIRIHKNTPSDVWELAIESSKACGGVPSFENDDLIIPMLVKRGRSLEDARDYCIIGCVEPSGSGNEWSASGGPGSEVFFNLLGPVIMAIHNGKNPLTGFDGGLKTGYLYDYVTFEDFKSAFEAQLKYFLDWQITGGNCFELMYSQYFPAIVASTTMDNCVETGKDALQGGCKYNSTGLTGCGIGNVADSLMAIKKLCFDDKIVTTRELYDALIANWEGYEDLHQQITFDIPHYGNDIDEVDQLGVWAMKLANDHVSAATNPRGGNWAFGTFTMTVHVDYGSKTDATPDGRKRGEALAEAISSRQGFDRSGVISYLNTVTKLPQNILGNGDQMNLRFSPSCVSGKEGVEKLRHLISTYFDEGGMEVQFNVVDTQTLYKAQENPDDYRNLIVRIAGFSVYFVEMPKVLQDDFISRTEHMAIS